MKLSLPAIALAALCGLASNAHAVTSYAFTFNGSLVHFLDAFECPGLTCPGGGAPVQLPWSGDVSVKVGDGDGVFSGTDILLFSLRSDYQTYTSSTLFTPPGLTNFFVSVSGGIPSLGGAFLVNPARTFTFAGTSMSVQQPAEFHFGPTFGTVALVPVPESATYATLIAGLALLGVARRIRSARAAASRPRAARSGSARRAP
jgi:hypothetical protein